LAPGASSSSIVISLPGYDRWRIESIVSGCSVGVGDGVGVGVSVDVGLGVNVRLGAAVPAI
jgi:hypothetical protein